MRLVKYLMHLCTFPSLRDALPGAVRLPFQDYRRSVRTTSKPDDSKGEWVSTKGALSPGCSTNELVLLLKDLILLRIEAVI